MEPLTIVFFVVVALVLSVETGLYVLLWNDFGRAKGDRSR